MQLKHYTSNIENTTQHRQNLAKESDEMPHIGSIIPVKFSNEEHQTRTLTLQEKRKIMTKTLSSAFKKAIPNTNNAHNIGPVIAISAFPGNHEKIGKTANSPEKRCKSIREFLMKMREIKANDRLKRPMGNEQMTIQNENEIKLKMGVKSLTNKYRKSAGTMRVGQQTYGIFPK